MISRKNRVLEEAGASLTPYRVGQEDQQLKGKKEGRAEQIGAPAKEPYFGNRPAWRAGQEKGVDVA